MGGFVIMFGKLSVKMVKHIITIAKYLTGNVDELINLGSAEKQNIFPERLI